MFEQIKDLTIQGGCFSNETKLEGIFKDKINIVYGHNGSGKSTISRAMADLANELNTGTPTQSGMAKVLFNDEQKKLLRGKLYVYNEDFVDRNVKVEDGLESIVMLGQDNITNEQARQAIQAEIDDLNKQRDKLIKERDGDPNAGIESLQSQIESVEKSLDKSLKSADSYASRGKDIKGIARNISVKLEDFIGIEMNPNGFDPSITNLTKELTEGIQNLQNVQDGNTITWNNQLTVGADVDTIDNLLKKKIQKVELNDPWLQELANTAILTIETAKHTIIEPGLDRCPYCQQPISDEWMQTLKDNISKVLNKDVDNFKQELDTAIQNLTELSINVPDIVEEKFSNEVNTLKLACQDWNNFILILRQLLENKKQNLYNESQGIDLKQYDQFKQALDTGSSDLSNKIADYNSEVSNIKKKQEHLLNINKWLAYKENETLFDKIRNLKTQQAINKAKLDNCETALLLRQQEKSALDSGRQNSKMAMDFINKCLTTVFADKNRMELVEIGENGKYRLTVRKQNVLPKNVSIGERNILALSYFFAKIFENTSKQDRFNKDLFIVIDDPVSSFDRGNQAGVWILISSYIKKLFDSDHRNPRRCKLLVFSHDRQCIVSFGELKKDLIGGNNMLQLCSDTEHRLAIYEDRGSVYMILLNQLYDFAISNDSDSPQFYGMGNILRQALESFAKYYNNSDCKKILDDWNVWNKFYIKNIVNGWRFNDDFWSMQDKMRDVLKDRLSRNITNILSHSANNPDIMTEEAYFEPQELKQLIKDFFIFMASVASNHAHGFLYKSQDDERKEQKKNFVENSIRELFNEVNHL